MYILHSYSSTCTYVSNFHLGDLDEFRSLYKNLYLDELEIHDRIQKDFYL